MPYQEFKSEPGYNLKPSPIPNFLRMETCSAGFVLVYVDMPVEIARELATNLNLAADKIESGEWTHD